MKRITLILLLFILMSCRSTRHENIALSSVEGQLLSLYQKSSASGKDGDDLATLLNQILLSDQPQDAAYLQSDKYYSDSLSAIEQVAKNLNLSTTSLGNGNLLIYNDNIVDPNISHLFVIKLQPEFSSANSQQKFWMQKSVRSNNVYGYQAMYPKGYLISLLWALSKNRETVQAWRNNITVLVTYNVDTLKNVTPQLQKRLGANGVVLLPVTQYPFLHSMDGEVSWSISVPRDDTWLISAVTNTTDHGNIEADIQYRTMENNKNGNDTKKFPLNLSVDDALYHYQHAMSNHIASFVSCLRGVMADPNLKVDQHTLKNISMNSLLNYLERLTFEHMDMTDSQNHKISLSHIRVDSIITSGGNMTITLSARIQGEDANQVLPVLKNDYLGHINAQDLDNNPASTLPVNINLLTYHNSYDISRQSSLVQDNTKKINDIYQELMDDDRHHTSPVLVSYPKELSPNMILMGAFFQLPDFYSTATFIPKEKLYFDAQLLLRFIRTQVG